MHKNILSELINSVERYNSLWFHATKQRLRFESIAQNLIQLHNYVRFDICT